MSLKYYEHNADQFFKDTVNVDMSELYQPFVNHIKNHGRVLDAGCGSGRDTKAFIDMGFTVDAFDSSREMVKLATNFTGINVKCKSFDDIDADNKYDGIWACASLLHVPEAELLNVFIKMERALAEQGVWYMSFKYGDTQREKEGRVFTDLNEQKLHELIVSCESLKRLNAWVTRDKRPDKNEKWLNALVTKVPVV